MAQNMADEQNNQANRSSGSNKLMLLVGLLLGIAIISTVAFFVLLFKGDSSGNTSKNEPQVKGAEIEKEDAGNSEQQAAGDKLAIQADDHIKGDANAPVTVVVYDDFECPFCGAFEGTNQEAMDYLKSRYPSWIPVMPNLIKDYVNTGKVKLVYRHYPLPASMHPNAFSAAEASECAGAQGKFWEMHDKLFEMNNSKTLNIENYKSAARALGLNMDKYNACMDNHEMKKKVDAQKASGESLGVNGTPGSFINGDGLSGAVSYDEFKQVVDEKLK